MNYIHEIKGMLRNGTLTIYAQELRCLQNKDKISSDLSILNLFM